MNIMPVEANQLAQLGGVKRDYEHMAAIRVHTHSTAR